MKHTRQERLDIGRRIYEDEINKNVASDLYGISPETAREYMRYYRDVNHLPAKDKRDRSTYTAHTACPIAMPAALGLDELESMSREELIRELIKARINEARLKKGYQVKGAGAEKEYIPLDNKNTK